MYSNKKYSLLIESKCYSSILFPLEGVILERSSSKYSKNVGNFEKIKFIAFQKMSF